MTKALKRIGSNFFVLIVIGVILSSIIANNSNFHYFSLYNNKLLSNSKDINLSNHSFINSSNQKLFWFIQITDTQFLWYNNEKISNFYQFLNESYKEIDPLFIINTGDLVHANNGANQDKNEWIRYRKALEDNNMNSSIYFDLMGNHDAANDSTFIYFLNYSMTGKTYNNTQYSFNKTFSFGDYAFIGLNTAKNSYNLFEFAFLGYLDSNELDWYENELEKYRDFDKTFVFGHHPILFPPFFSIYSETNSGGKSFSELNNEYKVFCYFSGHIHLNTFQRLNNLFMITTANFDQNNGIYRIVSLDNNQLSTSLEYVNKWPQGIITYPPSEEYLSNNANVDENKIRVLAWDPKGVNSVEWCTYDILNENLITDWKPLYNNIEDNPLWEDNLDIPQVGRFLLKVRIVGGSGSTIKELIYNSQNTLIFIPILIIALMLIGLLSLTILICNYFGLTIQRLKKNIKHVLKKARNPI